MRSSSRGRTNDWRPNGDKKVDQKPNLGGEGNYVFLEAKGRGHSVGVTQSIFAESGRLVPAIR
jgi:hypothetical protein